MHECENSRWSVRELKRQRDSLLFHRLIRNKDKEEISKLANKGIELQNPEDILHDPYYGLSVNFQPVGCWLYHHYPPDNNQKPVHIQSLEENLSRLE